MNRALSVVARRFNVGRAGLRGAGAEAGSGDAPQLAGTSKMRAVFIRHNLDATPETLEDLWSRRLIAVHYESIASTDPEDYGLAGKAALKRLIRYCSSGAIVGATYRSIHPDTILVGEIEKGSQVEVRPYSKDPDYNDYLFKVVQLQSVREVPYLDYPLHPPSHQDKVRAVFGERAATYTASSSHTDPEVLAWVVERAKPEAHWRALDVATGTGHTAFALVPHVGHVTGVDLTPEMLAEARGLQARNGLRNVSFALADVHRLPFAAHTFDLVTARRAPHHFADIGRALAEMGRVLRPGGRLVIDDRSVPEDDEVDEIMNRLDVLHDASHVREYRPSEWRVLLAEADFRVESVEPFALLRPISALHRDALPADCAAIDRIMARLTERQRSLMGVTHRDGELHHLHFFVMIAAVKP